MTYLSLILCLVVLLVARPVQAQKIAGVDYTAHLFSIGKGQPALLAADINQDGHQDLIAANYQDNDLAVFHGNGKGALNLAYMVESGLRPSGLACADIDLDGALDIVVANHETSYLTLLFGDNKGRLRHTQKSTLTLNMLPHPHVVYLADLNADNRVELLVDSREQRGLLMLKGLTKGGFDSTGQVIDVGGDPYRGFAVADINADGRLDIVTPNQRNIAVLLNRSLSSIDFSLTKIAQPHSPFAVELADLNGDSHLDIITANNGNSYAILPGDGVGQFDSQGRISIEVATGAKQIATGDVNGDGIADALVSNWSGQIALTLGSKQSLKTLRFNHPNIPNPWAVAIADYNEDGRGDLVIADGDSQSAILYLSQVKSLVNSK